MGIIQDCFRYASQIVQDMKQFGKLYSDVKSAHDVMKKVRDISTYEEGWLWGPHRKYDSKTWNKEVLPLIGSTDVYNRKIGQTYTVFNRCVGLREEVASRSLIGVPVSTFTFICGTNYFKCDVSVHKGSPTYIFTLDLSSTPAEIRAHAISMVMMLGDITKWDKEIKYIECVGEGCPEDDSSYEFESLISSMKICYISEGRKYCNSF